MASKKTVNEPKKSDATLKSEENDCEMQSEVRQSASVYDFLYQDVRRVGSFLAQFDEYGVRQSIKATESTGRAQSVKGAAVGTLGLPAIIGASANVDVTRIDDTKDLAEHTFDPLWANSRRLLDYLNEHELIEYDPYEAHLGTFVLTSGSLSIIDTDILVNIFEDDELFDVFVRQACSEEGVELDSPKAKEMRQNLKVVGKLPRAIHMFSYGDGYNVWATLTKESLVTSAHDIAAKHGALMRGQWNVLGILDAWPDVRDLPTDENPEPQTLDEIGANILHDGLIKVAANYTNISRNALGRSRQHFGITPILIFRKVSGR